MQFNTALLFLLSAAGLLALYFRRPRAAAGLGIVILFLVLVLNLGRMSPPTAISFILTGLCLLMGVIKKERGQKIRLFLATCVLTVSISVLLGYLFKIEFAHGWWSLAGMALHTSVCFTLLALGLMALNWQIDHRFWPAVLVFFSGLMVSLFLLQIISGAAESHYKTIFTSDAHSRVLAFQRQLEYAERVLHGTRAFYEGSKSVGREGFRFFTQRSLEGVKSIQAIEWVENLPGQEGGRPARYPVTYTEPFEMNEAALGFDHASDPNRKAAIERARDENATMATEPLHLFRESSETAKGLLVFEPVYKNGADISTLEGRRDHFTGALAAVIRLPIFADKALAYVTAKPLQFYLFDASNPSQTVLAYSSDASISPEQLEQFARTNFKALTGLYHTEKLAFGGRDYLILIRADPLYISQNQVWYPAVTFCLMLMLSIAATFFVLQTMARTRDLERLTNELTIASEKLTMLAVTDPLTGLLNRRGFEQTLERELAFKRRYGTDFYIVMMDIDDFKSINERFGHTVGDLALQQIAAKMKAAIRPTDYAARIGGDEFLVLLVQPKNESVLKVAERIRHAVAECEVPVPGREPIHATASAGLIDLTDGDTRLDSIIQKADALLKQSKRSGKNRISTSKN